MSARSEKSHTCITPTQLLDVAPFFRDPDGDALTFSAKLPNGSGLSLSPVVRLGRSTHYSNAVKNPTPYIAVHVSSYCCPQWVRVMGWGHAISFVPATALI
jgi:hypothetical protein